MKIQQMIVALLAIHLVCSKFHQRTNQHQKKKSAYILQKIKERQLDQDDTEEVDQEQRRLRKVDGEIFKDNGEKAGSSIKKDKKQFEYVKTEEEMKTYNASKNSDKVEVQYQSNNQGSDTFGNSYMGQFYVLSNDFGVLGQQITFNKFAVYLNDFSLYFVDITSPNSGGYRNVVGSIPLEHMIIAGRDYEQIQKQGKCCAFLSGGSGIKYVGDQLDKIAEFKGFSKEQMASRRLDSALFELIKSQASIGLFQSMLCLEIKFNAESDADSTDAQDNTKTEDDKFNYGYQKSDGLKNKLALCSINQKMVSQLKQKMMNSVITNIYHKRNEYDISVITNTQQEFEMSKETQIYEKYTSWSYSKIEQWPTSCRYLPRSQRGRRLKSPVNIRNMYIDQFYAQAFDNEIKDLEEDENVSRTDNRLVSQKGECVNNLKNMLDEVCALSNMNQMVKSSLKVEQKVESVITDLDALKDMYGGQMPVDTKMQQDNYNMHPTYSFRGYHENMVVGLLGQIDLQVPAYMTKYNLLKGFKTVQKKYQAFAIKFKYPSEHRVDGAQAAMELQVMMSELDGPKESQNKKLLTKLIGQQMGSAYKQYGLGYVDTEGIETEKDLHEMTDLILSISINVNMTMTRPNMFVHFISNEDWYEAQEIQLDEQSRFSYGQKLKIVTKDLEAPMDQIMKVEDSEASKDTVWQNICYPGSIQCLYQQIYVNKGFYFYQGTETTPPCEKEIDYVVMRYPLQIPQEQFEQLRQNVFMYRNDFMVKQNINMNFNDLSRTDVYSGLIYRFTDKTPFDPSLCEETDTLRTFINNAMKKINNTQTMGQSSIELYNVTISTQTYYYEKNKETAKYYAELYKEKVNKGTEVSEKEAFEMYKFFYGSNSRYYRRLFSKYLLNRNLKSILKFFLEASDEALDWEPQINGRDKGAEGGPLANDDALVMVSGSLKAQQKISTTKIERVERVISKKKSSSSSNSVKIQISKIKSASSSSSSSQNSQGNKRRRKRRRL